jgi:hypothetical protein
MYCSGPWQLHPRIRRAQRKIRSFFTFGRARREGATAQKGQEPAGDEFSHRDLSRGTGYPSVHFVTD